MISVLLNSHDPRNKNDERLQEITDWLTDLSLAVFLRFLSHCRMTSYDGCDGWRKFFFLLTIGTLVTLVCVKIWETSQFIWSIVLLWLRKNVEFKSIVTFNHCSLWHFACGKILKTSLGLYQIILESTKGKLTV